MGRRDQETFRRVPEIPGGVLRDGDDSSATFELAYGFERGKRDCVAQLFYAADHGGADARRGRHGSAARRNIPGASGKWLAERSGADEQDRENGGGLKRVAQGPGGGAVRWTGDIERARGG